SSECRATMGKSSPLPSCSGSRPPGFDTDTFGPGDRSRMGKSGGVIGSTTRSSGGGTGSRTSRRPRTLSEAGRADTTTTASPSRSTAAPPPKNLPRTSHRSGSPRRRMSTSGHSQNPGVNLDETQQGAQGPARPPRTIRHDLLARGRGGHVGPLEHASDGGQGWGGDARGRGRHGRGGG